MCSVSLGFRPLLLTLHTAYVQLRECQCPQHGLFEDHPQLLRELEVSLSYMKLEVETGGGDSKVRTSELTSKIELGAEEVA